MVDPEESQTQAQIMDNNYDRPNLSDVSKK